MKKDRLLAFTDGVLAIIMTILIMGLERPSELSLRGLMGMGWSFFAYLLSFFWIGSVWIAHNSIWEKVNRISGVIVWWSLVFLFFFSFLPYATGLVSSNYDNRFAQAFYGVVVILANSGNCVLYKLLDGPNSDNPELLELTKEYRRVLLPDILIKIIFLILTLTVYPTIMLYGVLFSAGYLQLAKIVASRIRKKDHEKNIH